MTQVWHLLRVLCAVCLVHTATSRGITGIQLQSQKAETSALSPRTGVVECGAELTNFTGSLSLQATGDCSLYVNCNWSIVAQDNPESSSKGLLVAFKSFDLYWTDCVHAFPADNFTSTVDELNATSEYSSYCGFQPSGTSFSSNADKLILAFRVCSSWCYPGFSLLYTSDHACSTPRRLLENSGSFSSPFFPETYTRNLECSWYIAVSSTHVLVLNFHYFDVGGTSADECSSLNGYLNITGSQSGNLKYCNGNKPSSTVHLRGANTNVVFHINTGAFIPSDGRGFSIAYEVVPQGWVTWSGEPPAGNAFNADSSESSQRFNDRSMWNSNPDRQRLQTWSSHVSTSDNASLNSASCNDENGNPIILSNSTGTIESPNHPDNYPANVKCAWRILPHGDTGVFMVLTSVKLHWADCIHIAPYSTTAPTETTYFCGYNTQATIYLQPDALINFQSCGGFSSPGFRILYTSDNACYSGGSGRQLPITGGSFTSPFYPNSVVADLDCRWFVVVPSGQMLVLTFDSFVLDGPSTRSCSSAYASVGVTAKNINSIKFCSSNPPTKKLYLTGTVSVTYDSGTLNPIGLQGFEASYIVDRENTLLCGTGIRLAGGEFSYVGRLEIMYNGEWGTVCGEGFNTEAANVACNNLGYGYAGVLMGNSFGPGTGPIWLTNVDCSGRESCLGRCGHDEWGTNSTCSHDQDVSLSCQFSICTGTSDPHYTTYDNKRFTYMGTCKYLMSAPTSLNSVLPEFQVFAKNYRCSTSPTLVSCPEYVEVVYDGDIFRIAKTVFSVNGDVVQLPYTNRNNSYTVRYSGSYSRYETSFGLRVEMFSTTIKVYVPGASDGHMTGICGNNDDDATNDFTLANGTFVGNVGNAPDLVGNSFIVSDSDGSNCEIGQPAPPCPSPPADHIAGCGHLTNTGGVFGECVSHIGPDDAQANYENCLTDACYTDNSICESHRNFVEECAAYDIIYTCDTWRMATGCGVSVVECPEGMEYRCNATACPSTCSDRDAEINCIQPNVEACVCPDGQLLHNGQCVSTCPVGCVDGNQQFHPIGEEWPALNNCSTLTCVYCVDCELNGRIEISRPGCQADEICFNNMCMQTTTVRTTTTTTTVPTTVPVPVAPDIFPGPYVGMTFNGSWVTNDIVSFDCQDSFSQEFRRNFEYVISRLNDLTNLGLLCIPGLQISPGSVQLSAMGTVGRVVFTAMTGVNIPDHVTVAEVESCGWAVSDFVKDFRNWRQPIIPSVWGCPSVTFVPETYDLRQAAWQCI